jgi:uncharacterized repeat protein (TIGR01451 family)
MVASPWHLPDARVVNAQATPSCILYGVQSSGDPAGVPSRPLLELDPATGAVVRTIGETGFGLTGLALNPRTGELFGTTAQAGVGNFSRQLIRINRSTGAGTVVGPIEPGGGGIADLAFREDGTLFGWSENTDDLITINTTTGAGTVVGNAGISTRGSGLAFSSTGTLFLAGNNANGALRTVNPATGLTTVGPTLNGAPLPSQPINAASFHPDGTLFGVNNAIAITTGGTTHLVTINTANGQVTNRGTTIRFLDAIEFDCSPFPADLSISKAASALTVAAGETVTFTMTVRNNSATLADNVTVTDTIPGGTSFVSAMPSQGTCSGTSTIICALGRILPGTSATATLVVRTGVSQSGTISSTAAVVASQSDTAGGNNTASADVAVLAPTATPTATATPTSTPTPTPTPAPAISANNDDEEEEQEGRLTEEERHQRERTNRSGLDDYRTEGNVVAVRCNAASPVPVPTTGFVTAPDDVPYALIATRDGIQQVRLLDEARTTCRSIREGDYLEASGEKQHELLFEAESVTITRNVRGR